MPNDRLRDVLMSKGLTPEEVAECSRSLKMRM